MHKDELDDQALHAAVSSWQADEEFDAYRTEWMLDQAAAGRVIPTGSDAQLFALTQLLRGHQLPRPEARQRAFEAMMTEATRHRDPSRIERTRQEMLRAFAESQVREQNAEGDEATS